MIEFQRLLMGDKIRNAAFARALQTVIRPGRTVLADIGSGTGFLSFLASRYGAKECHLYEMDEDPLRLSEKIAKENGITNCRFIGKHSQLIKKPVQADVVVSETLGNFALEEGIIETLNDSVARFLIQGGTVIPQKLRQFVIPVTSPRLYDELNVWPKVGHKLDYRSAEEKTLQNIYVREIASKDLLPNGAQEWDSIDFRKKASAVRASDVSWKVTEPISVYGFCLYWEAELIPGEILSTSPLSDPTHWQQIFLPVLRPVAVAANNMLTLSIHTDTRPEVKVRVKWKVAVQDDKEKELVLQTLDMKNG